MLQKDSDAIVIGYFRLSEKKPPQSQRQIDIIYCKVYVIVYLSSAQKAFHVNYVRSKDTTETHYMLGWVSTELTRKTKTNWRR